MPREPGKPKRINEAISRFLADAGIAERVEQARVIPEWPDLVGPEIARVTEPQAVTADGTLFVAVRSHGWMSELSLLEPQIVGGGGEQRRVGGARDGRQRAAIGGIPDHVLGRDVLRVGGAPAVAGEEDRTAAAEGRRVAPRDLGDPGRKRPRAAHRLAERREAGIDVLDVGVGHGSVAKRRRSR